MVLVLFRWGSETRALAVGQPVGGAGMGTDGFTMTAQGQIQLFAVLAHPADLARRHADHQGVGLDVLVDDGARADEGVFADDDAADDGAVGAQGGALFDQGVAVLVLALDQRARVVDVGEHHAGAAEHALFQSDVVIDGDVVLDFAAVADDDLVADEDVLAKGYPGTDAGAAADMDEMPDARSFADLRAGIDDGGFVLVMGHGFWTLTDVADISGTLPPCCDTVSKRQAMFIG